MKNAIWIVGGIGAAALANYLITKHMGRTFLWKKTAMAPSTTEVAKAVASAATAGVDGFNNATAERTAIFRRNGFASPMANKYTSEITNKPKGCPQGSHQTTLSDGSFGCLPNTK